MNRLAWLHTSSWAGRALWPVVVLYETPKRYRVLCVRKTCLPGRVRWVPPGTLKLVPKSAVSFGRKPNETHQRGSYSDTIDGVPIEKKTRVLSTTVGLHEISPESRYV